MESDNLSEMVDDEVATVLESGDRNQAFGVLAEFFSSDEKYKRFLGFTQSAENKELVTRTMVADPVRIVLTFFDVVKTGGGGGRLAKAIVDRNDIYVG